MRNLDWLTFITMLSDYNACQPAYEWVSKQQHDLKRAIEECPFPDWIAWAVNALPVYRVGAHVQAIVSLQREYDQRYGDISRSNISNKRWGKEQDALRKEILERMRAILLPLITEDEYGKPYPR